jgi:hypothetical protein
MLIAISGLAKYRLTKKIPVLGESGMFRFTSLYRTFTIVIRNSIIIRQIGCLDNAFDLVNRIWRYSGNQINTVVKIWLIAHIPKPAVGSLLEHGCKDGKFGLEPILFEGQMSSDFLQDLVCNRIVIFDICPVCNHIVTEV